LPKIDYRDNTDVLNGIAFNPANGHLFVTGKNWPRLFEVTINEIKK
jgi:glutaminyl-peptide cyclotransferase